MRKIIFYVAFLPLLMINIARAVVVPNLNVATVPVENTSASVRQAVLPKALGQVLVKLSGSSTVMTVPAVQHALDNLDSFIQSYGYSNQQKPDGQSQLLLQVTFEQKALEQLLHQAGQANWSSRRPLTLLWMQMPNQGETTILSNTNNSPLLQKIQEAAQSRGVPILLPAMDLQDQSFVNTKTDTFDSSLLKQAVDHYGAEAVLAGNIQQNGDQWQGEWLLLMNDKPYQWHSTASTVDELLQRGINDMVNLMANHLAATNADVSQAPVILQVSNVQNLDEYAAIVAIIKHLTPVTGVTIKNMNGSDLLLQVKTTGGAQALADALSLEHRFTALPTSDDSNKGADLFYQWKGKNNL